MTLARPDHFHAPLLTSTYKFIGHILYRGHCFNGILCILLQVLLHDRLLMKKSPISLSSCGVLQLGGVFPRGLLTYVPFHYPSIIQPRYHPLYYHIYHPLYYHISILPRQFSYHSHIPSFTHSQRMHELFHPFSIQYL